MAAERAFMISLHMNQIINDLHIVVCYYIKHFYVFHHSHFQACSCAVCAYTNKKCHLHILCIKKICLVLHNNDKA